MSTDACILFYSIYARHIFMWGRIIFLNRNDFRQNFCSQETVATNKRDLWFIAVSLMWGFSGSENLKQCIADCRSCWKTEETNGFRLISCSRSQNIHLNSSQAHCNLEIWHNRLRFGIPKLEARFDFNVHWMWRNNLEMPWWTECTMITCCAQKCFLWQIFLELGVNKAQPRILDSKNSPPLRAQRQLQSENRNVYQL